MKGFDSFFKVYSVMILVGLSLTIYFPGNHLASDQSSSGSGSSSSSLGGGGGYGGGGSYGGGGGGGYVSTGYYEGGGGTTAAGNSYGSSTTFTYSSGSGGSSFSSGVTSYSGSSFSGGSFGGSASYGGGVSYGGYDPNLSNADWAALDQADTDSILEYDPETGMYNLPDVFDDLPNDSQPSDNQPTELAGPPAPQPEMPNFDPPQFDQPDVDMNPNVSAPNLAFSPNVSAPDLGSMNVQPANNTAIGNFGTMAGAIDFTSPTQTAYSAPSLSYNQVYDITRSAFQGVVEDPEAIEEAQREQARAEQNVRIRGIVDDLAANSNVSEVFGENPIAIEWSGTLGSSTIAQAFPHRMVLSDAGVLDSGMSNAAIDSVVEHEFEHVRASAADDNLGNTWVAGSNLPYDRLGGYGRGFYGNEIFAYIGNLQDTVYDGVPFPLPERTMYDSEGNPEQVSGVEFGLIMVEAMVEVVSRDYGMGNLDPLRQTERISRAEDGDITVSDGIVTVNLGPDNEAEIGIDEEGVYFIFPGLGTQPASEITIMVDFDQTDEHADSSGHDRALVRVRSTEVLGERGDFSVTVEGEGIPDQPDTSCASCVADFVRELSGNLADGLESIQEGIGSIPFLDIEEIRQALDSAENLETSEPSGEPEAAEVTNPQASVVEDRGLYTDSQQAMNDFMADFDISQIDLSEINLGAIGF